MTTNPAGDQQRIIHASLDEPFRFEQGASLHVGILGMVGRPSGPHDDDPFLRGIWHSGRSHSRLDLSELQASDEEAPELHLWFDAERTALDISGAFAGVPADALSGSGIPPAVLDGPVMVERRGDAGDGITAMLTQMCAGKIAIHPHALIDVISSDHLTDFAEHQVEDAAPLRAFNASMTTQAFLETAGLTGTMLINQIAVLGYDLRTELGTTVVESFTEHLQSARVQLAWFVDESDRVHTAQVVLALTDFITEVFTSDQVIAQLASEERIEVDEMAGFAAKAAQAGGLVYIHAIWQKFSFDDSVAEIAWPDAEDLSADVAAQARHMRSQTKSAPREPAPSTEPRTGERGTITVDPAMLDHMRAASGAMYFALSQVDGDAVAAMEAAQAAVMKVGHPDEPSEPLASYLSDIVATPDGAQFWADISDMEEQTLVLKNVLAAVVDAASGVVTSGHLGAGEHMA